MLPYDARQTQVALRHPLVSRDNLQVVGTYNPVNHFAEPQRASAEIARLQARTRAGLGTWPTPLERREGPRGVPLWIKRDDRSGLGRGGAKARKIDLIVGHMLDKGYDELITVAGNVTNLAFDLLPALAQLGLKATLFIADDPPIPAHDRHVIFGAIESRVRLIGATRSEAARRACAAYAAAKLAGGRPILLLPGAAHPAGVLGNALGFLEMTAQLEAAGERLPSTVFVTAATGTTVAGFLLAEGLLRASGRAPIRVVGVEAYGGPTRAQTLGLLRWAERAFGLSGRVPRTNVEIDGSALAGGFGRYTDAHVAVCDAVAAGFGLAIDPIFGGKTWSVMEARMSDLVPRGGSVLYWHCGYTPEWQALGTAVREGTR